MGLVQCRLTWLDLT